MLRSDENKGYTRVIGGIIGCLFFAGAACAEISWQQQANLFASDRAENNYFGYCVSISGDYAITGALHGAGNEADTGSAYIFRHNGTQWLQQARLIAADGAANDNFGHSVSISGDYAIVGAPYNNYPEYSCGSAYIFKRSGANWLQQTKPTASDAAVDDLFGYSVSISGDYAVVGARYGDGTEVDSGSAYIFKRNGENWIQQDKLTADDGATGDNFGSSVSISGSQVIVGAFWNNGSESNSGSAYIFIRDGENWTQQAKLTASDGRSQDSFGNCVSISGGRAIVGAEMDDCYGLQNCGSAYIFDKPVGGWVDSTETAKLKAPDGEIDDRFGESASISGDYAIVAAGYDDDNGSQSGSAYIFRYYETGWFMQDKLTASDGEIYDHFGFSASLSDKWATVGAALKDYNEIKNCGSAYIFKRACLEGDLSGDCCVDFVDFAIFALQWLQTGCDQTDWCSGADLDSSSDVDCGDFAVFAQHWGKTGCADPDWCGGADLDYSSQVDWADLAIFAGQWLQGGCADLTFCDGADLNHSGEVDWSDLDSLTNQWLQCN